MNKLIESIQIYWERVLFVWMCWSARFGSHGAKCFILKENYISCPKAIAPVMYFPKQSVGCNLPLLHFWLFTQVLALSQLLRQWLYWSGRKLPGDSEGSDCCFWQCGGDGWAGTGKSLTSSRLQTRGTCGRQSAYTSNLPPRASWSPFSSERAVISHCSG